MLWNYGSLFLLFFVYISFFYAVIALCDIPYQIAKKRNHPQQDAIQVAGWVSLFTLHLIWPFLWIWATLYQEDRGWGLQQSQQQTKDLENKTTQSLESSLEKQLSQLQSRFDKVEQTLAEITADKSSAKPVEGDS